MANVNTKAHVLVRDRFTCQYCGTAVILAQAIKVLDEYAPDLQLWDLHGKREPLRTRWATVDHVTPELNGGMDTLDNLVACCVSCNSRKGGASAPAPAKRHVHPHWDGLSSVFLGLAKQYDDRLSTEDRKWQAALMREHIASRTDNVEQVVEILRRAKEVGSSELDALVGATRES